MRREHRDELLRTCLTINALLRGELTDVRQALKARNAEAKYNPNWRLQPRAPRGTAEGGQWVNGAAWSERTAQTTPSHPATREKTPKQLTQQQSQTRAPPPQSTTRPPSAPEPRTLLLARFGPAATLMTGEAIMRELNTRTERARVAETIRRFRLDAHSANDVLAARAHVWATHIAPSILVEPFSNIPFGGPVNERVALALLRFEQQHPGALGLAEAGEEDARQAIRTVVRSALNGRPTPQLHIPSLEESSTLDLRLPITYTREEADLVLTMHLQGRSTQQIQTALDAVRRNRSAFRNSAGTAFSSRPHTIVQRRWLGPTTKSASIPEQVAVQLGGRRFSNFDEFRAAFWRAVANSDLASQFNRRDLALMRRGYAPVVDDEREHYGGLTTYIIHHRHPIAAGGAVFDMSNMLIVTPSRHQDILPPSEHFGPRRRQRNPND